MQPACGWRGAFRRKNWERQNTMSWRRADEGNELILSTSSSLRCWLLWATAVRLLCATSCCLPLNTTNTNTTFTTRLHEDRKQIEELKDELRTIWSTVVITCRRDVILWCTQ
jgi:hypothetical protein